jgi:hypothetical protein
MQLSELGKSYAGIGGGMHSMQSTNAQRHYGEICTEFDPNRSRNVDSKSTNAFTPIGKV